MNNAKRFATPLIAVAMMTLPMMAQAQSSQQGNATNSAISMSPEAQASQAYRDGVESATIDMAAKRPLDPTKSFRYSHPPMKKGSERDAYLAGFAAGYKAHVAQNGGQAGQ